MSARSHRTSLALLLPPKLTAPRYAAAKNFFLNTLSLTDDIRTHIMSSFVAGTVATTICAPADVLKSRIQSAAGGAVSPHVPCLSMTAADDPSPWDRSSARASARKAPASS
jgi:transmembrane carrier protein